MSNIKNTTRATLAVALLLALQPAAQAGRANGYYDMCLQSVNMPKPFGEWDLKGNPKLPQYCKCFEPLFTARATKALEDMQKQGGKPQGTLEQSNAEELAMRNTCRKQVGLPAATDPNADLPKDKRSGK